MNRELSDGLPWFECGLDRCSIMKWVKVTFVFEIEFTIQVLTGSICPGWECFGLDSIRMTCFCPGVSLRTPVDGRVAHSIYLTRVHWGDRGIA